MLQVVGSVTVAGSSRDAAYDLISDITRMGEWSPECVRCEWITGRGAVGSRFLGHNRSGASAWTTECEVIVADRPTTFAWDVLTLAPSPRTSVWRFRITEEVDGRVTIEERFEMTAPPDGLRAVLERTPPHRRAAVLEARRQGIQRGIGTTLERMRAQLEAPSSARLSPMDLRQRWIDAGGPSEHFDDVVARYGEPHRAYHTIHHVEHVLGKVDEIGQGHDHAVVLAAILHDVIYDTARNDNEARSADYAREVLAGRREAERVATLIEATKTHEGPAGDDGLDALLDADLSTFADDDEGRNGELIRQEYASVPEEAFQVGRRRVLQSFLEREPLYRTELMRTRYEAKAKANIRAAIDRIGSSPSSSSS